MLIPPDFGGGKTGFDQAPHRSEMQKRVVTGAGTDLFRPFFTTT